MKKLFMALSYNYPFTVSGNVVFYSSVYFLGMGFSSSNYTAISVSLFFLVFILAVWGYIFTCTRIAPVERIVWKSEGIADSSGYSGNRQMVSAAGSLPRAYSRYALIIRGRAATSGGVSPFFRDRYRSDNRGFFDFGFYIPYPGLVSGMLYVFVEDIFALVRIRVLTEKLKDFPVLPGVNNSAVTDTSSVVKDMITKHRKYDNDTEKYLMREYVPGDLYRDINWKSSGRIDKLVTRISPGGKEESNLLTFIYLSGFSDGCDPYKGFVTGKYFREFFYTFLRRVKESAGNCELKVFIDGEECAVRENTDFFRAGGLLASSAAGKNRKDNSVDLSFLSEMDPGSNVSLFAETPDILLPALERMPGGSVSACYLPRLSSRQEKGTGEGSVSSIACVPVNYIFSALYTPFAFYRGFLARHLIKGKGRPGEREGEISLPGVRLEYVEIRTGRGKVRDALQQG